jgi:uncharacterized protein (TIGR03067 family)
MNTNREISTMRHLWRILLVKVFVVQAVVLWLFATAASAAETPNVVYIMADELGYYELSCMGNPNIQTPRLDRMAREGIRFTQALAGSSLCAPTRCCLMTGKHSGHTSVRTNGGGTPLRADEPTVASMLKQAGYATGGFGKWGCGGRGSTGVPEKHGFDVFLGYYDQVHAHSYYPPYIVRNSQEVPLTNNQGGSHGETYSHYVIFEAAKSFIRENKDRPFFCYMPITPPHGIFDIPDQDPAWSLYKDKPWPAEAKRFAAMVSMVDRQVGEVLDLLKELGLEENTIVFFCGDNGGNDYFRDDQHPRGFHGANKHPETGVEFRGKKGNLYEGGLRIPMIVRWPGHIRADRVSDLLWYFPDVMPTVAELTGAAPPLDIDGISIVPELLGEQAAGREQPQHEYLYWELNNQVAVRMQDWKAVKPGNNRDWELYDLGQDVSEQHDLAATHPELLGKLKSFAQAAHRPASEGEFFDREIHEKDRRAKFGLSKDDAIAQDFKRYEGTWRAVSLVINGEAARPEDARNITVVNQADGTWIVRHLDQEISRGSHVIDPTKSPKTIDITANEGEGVGATYLGIYELGANTRRLCLAEPGRERPLEFSSTVGNQNTLIEFERENPQ